MAWCHQATIHYLSQCWPRCMLPYGVTRPQWIKSAISEHMLSIKFMITCDIAFRWMSCNRTPWRISQYQFRLSSSAFRQCWTGSAFIKPDQRNPWIKDQIKITLLPTISHLLLPNFVSCGRACPSHMTQNLVTVGAKLWTADRFIVDPWSMDYADPVW